jgi:hypothetical protein
MLDAMRGLVVVVVVACTPRIEITHVTLRDPANLAVEVDTAAGPVTVMPPDAVRGEIPASVPPYIGTAEPGSWVERDGISIIAWCPTCTTIRRTTLGDRAELELAGNAHEVLRASGVRLRMRSEILAGTPCHRDRRTCVVPKLALELVTPLSNVASIDFERRLPRGSSDGQISPLVFGAFYAAVGMAIGGVGIADREHAVTIVGAGMIAAGVALIAWMAHDLRATDEHIAIAIGGR